MFLQKKNFVILLYVILFSTTSCFVDHDEIMTLPPREPGDPQLFIMNENIYTNQSYFNLETNQTTATNDKVIWDLNFACSDTCWSILINPATRARAAMAGTDFASITSLAGISSDSWKWDESDGCLDSTALCGILDRSKSIPQPSNNVYIIDRGYNSEGNKLGYKKIMLTGIGENEYQILFADLNGENEFLATIEKQQEIQFVSFSFSNGGSVLLLEPEKNNWHIVFTQYTGYTPDDFGNYVPYYVQGVLLNRSGIRAVIDTMNYFNEIDYDLAQTYSYSSKMDTIGHLWKDVTVNTETMESSYVCDTSRIHIIQTPQGEYFKLRFLGFYNGDGVRGFTSFEYQKL